MVGIGTALAIDPQLPREWLLGKRRHTRIVFFIPTEFAQLKLDDRHVGQKCDGFVFPSDRWQLRNRAAVARAYPQGPTSPDYTSIISDRHYMRLHTLIEDARAKGADVIEAGVAPERAVERPRTLVPVLIVGARSMSHAKGVFVQGHWSLPSLLKAPFGKLAEFAIAITLRARP